jgi:hypothetical protein
MFETLTIFKITLTLFLKDSALLTFSRAALYKFILALHKDMLFHKKVNWERNLLSRINQLLARGQRAKFSTLG